MPPHRQPRVVPQADDVDATAELRRDNAELRRQVELLTRRLDESVNMRHRDEDDVTVTDENPFAS